MIDQLRKIFSSLLVYDEGFENLDRKYKWFVTESNEVIGIHEEELTSKDALVLATFLSPYNIKFPILTDEEEKWRKVIHLTEPSANFEFKLDNPYRFVYFSIKKNQINPILFKEAIHGTFC